MERLRRQDLWLAVGLIFVAFVIRAHAIEALPPFNDESLHIRRAEKILVERDVSLTPFKLLVYYWIALFRPDRIHSIFIGRTAVSLFALIGLAGTFATARILFGRLAGTLALVLAAFSPFMIFFDRLAFADPLTSALAILVVWMSVRIARYGRCNVGQCPESIWTGLLCTLVVLSKTTGLPFLAMPIMAVLAFGTGEKPSRFDFSYLKSWVLNRLRAYQKPLKRVYITFGITFAPFMLHVLERAVSAQPVMIVNNNLVLGLAEDRPPLRIFLENLETVWNVNWILHSPVLWMTFLAVLVFMIRRRPYETVYLVSAVILPWGMSIVLGAELSTRYLTLGILPLLVLLAGGLATIGMRTFDFGGQTLSLRPIVMGLVGIWCLGFAIPFIDKAWNNPTELNLPSRDEWEYFTNFSAGYGLVDAADAIEKLPVSEPSHRVNVYGLVGSCHQMRLYLDNAEEQDDGRVWLTCPNYGWQGELLMEVADDIDQRLAVESIVYILAEPEIPYFELPDLFPRWQWEEVERYSRPHGGMEIILYHIIPLENKETS